MFLASCDLRPALHARKDTSHIPSLVACVYGPLMQASHAFQAAIYAQWWCSWAPERKEEYKLLVLLFLLLGFQSAFSCAVRQGRPHGKSHESCLARNGSILDLQGAS